MKTFFRKVKNFLQKYFEILHLQRILRVVGSLSFWLRGRRLRNSLANVKFQIARKHYFLFFLVFISIFFFSIKTVEAARVYFETPSSVNVGENMNLTIYTDTEGLSINSIEFVVSYDQNLLSFAGFSDENAMVKLWIDPPHEEIANQGKIYLSGIIPGGISGLYEAEKNNSGGLAPIPLVHLFFKAKNAGLANFSFLESKILQHDGLGSPFPYETMEGKILIKNDPNYINKRKSADNKKGDIIQTEKSTEDATKSNYSFFLIFWIVVFLFISGFLGHKLIKSKL